MVRSLVTSSYRGGVPARLRSGGAVGRIRSGQNPAALIYRLNEEIVRVLNRADVKEKFLNVGVEVVGSSPEELAAKVKSDMARLGKLIQDAGLRAD